MIEEVIADAYDALSSLPGHKAQTHQRKDIWAYNN
jgi:hypothetical protein